MEWGACLSFIPFKSLNYSKNNNYLTLGKLIRNLVFHPHFYFRDSESVGLRWKPGERVLMSTSGVSDAGGSWTTV